MADDRGDTSLLTMNQRTVVVALLRIRPGQAVAFTRYETKACAIAARHGGRLERRIATGQPVTEDPGEEEVHVWSFRDRAAFDAFQNDPALGLLADLRSRAIAKTTVLFGQDAASFIAPTESGSHAQSVTGLDHVYLSVSDMARSIAFYDSVMQALGFWKGDYPIAGQAHAHYFNGLLQITLRPAKRQVPHDPYAPGLHHLCLQAPDAAAVDRAYAALSTLGVSPSAPTLYPEYDPDYYATFFEDPDGLRLELLARMPARDDVLASRDRFTHFLNPLAALAGARDGVFHIATRAAWEAAGKSSPYAPPELSRDGFIHCSTRSQVLDTLSRYFKGRTDLCLLKLDPGRLAEDLRYERPAPTPERPIPEAYPHLYAPLSVDAVISVHPLMPALDGSFAWPDSA